VVDIKVFTAVFYITIKYFDCSWTWTVFEKFRTASGSDNTTVPSSLTEISKEKFITKNQWFTGTGE